MVSNIEKILQYVRCLTKQPIEYVGRRLVKTKCEEKDGRIVVGDETKRIILTDTIFYTDSCYKCGACDVSAANLFTKSEYDLVMGMNDEEFENIGFNKEDLHRLKEGLKEEIYEVNGKEVVTYCYKAVSKKVFIPQREKVLPRCTFLNSDSNSEFKCAIHPVESITCMMPHLRFFHVHGSNSTSIRISEYGRNWGVKCPAKFHPPESEEEFNKNRDIILYKLERLNKSAEDINVETYIPEVIQYIRDCDFENYKSKLHKNILHPVISKKLVKLPNLEIK